MLNQLVFSVEMLVIHQTLLSFSKLLRKMEGCKLSSFQITAAVRMKPLLSQENVDLRRAAFHLFGDLTWSINPENKSEAFKEQLEGNLITLLLHLSDPDPEVVKVSKCEDREKQKSIFYRLGMQIHVEKNRAVSGSSKDQ